MSSCGAVYWKQVSKGVKNQGDEHANIWLETDATECQWSTVCTSSKELTVQPQPVAKAASLRWISQSWLPFVLPKTDLSGDIWPIKSKISPPFPRKHLKMQKGPGKFIPAQVYLLGCHSGSCYSCVPSGEPGWVSFFYLAYLEMRLNMIQATHQLLSHLSVVPNLSEW